MRKSLDGLFLSRTSPVLAVVKKCHHFLKIQYNLIIILSLGSIGIDHTIIEIMSYNKEVIEQFNYIIGK